MNFLSMIIEMPMAYIGPGPGLSLLGSFLALFIGILISIIGIILLPFRFLLKRMRQRSFKKNSEKEQHN